MSFNLEPMHGDQPDTGENTITNVMVRDAQNVTTDSTQSSDPSCLSLIALYHAPLPEVNTYISAESSIELLILTDICTSSNAEDSPKQGMIGTASGSLDTAAIGIASGQREGKGILIEDHPKKVIKKVQLHEAFNSELAKTLQESFDHEDNLNVKDGRRFSKKRYDSILY